MLILYPGKQLGAYRIIKHLGQGRYGVCYLAEKDGRQIVLKKFKQNKLKNLYEAQILAQLQHPRIPNFISLVNENGFRGFALEKKDGKTIEAMLFKERHCFTNHEIYQIGQQLIEILKYLHQNGIVHCDLRIPNVIINHDQISLIDFGLARWEDNQNYSRQVDFSYLGDLLLYLLYSSYKEDRHSNRPWYEELELSISQKLFLKKLLQLSEPYQNIDEIAKDFKNAF